MLYEECLEKERLFYYGMHRIFIAFYWLNHVDVEPTMYVKWMEVWMNDIRKERERRAKGLHSSVCVCEREIDIYI